MKRIAIIGFGCAGCSAARAIRKADPDCAIHIYSDTDEAPYNPMLTTYYVKGAIGEDAMFPLGDLARLREELGAEIFSSRPVARLRAADRELITADGARESYDEIIIASGARAVIPPIKDIPKRGVYCMRTADHARRLAGVLDGTVDSALVVGAQMVGIKVVELLAARGVKTTLADMAGQVFPASAYPSVAGIIENRLSDRGIELRLGSAVSAVRDDGSELTTTFADGGSMRSDIVIFCSGIKPNIAFADPAELDIGVGIKTDLQMRTSVPHIYAAGDCCETKNVLTGENAYIGLWANSSVQGRVAGNTACGVSDSYGGNLINNITHYMDTDFISIGDIGAPGRSVAWAAPDGGWRFEARLSGGRILSINILDNSNVSGPVKSTLLSLACRPGAQLSPAAKLSLVRGGMPESIISQLGGDGND